MFAYDVDGDGDNDIITSNAAHAFGLGWYEQVRDGDEVSFKHHRIMGAKPSANKYGVLFSELHSVALADIDGDGLKDIVTGKTYWSHHEQSPMWDAGAVVYWFKTGSQPGRRRLDSAQGRRRGGDRPTGGRARCRRRWPAGHRCRRDEGRSRIKTPGSVRIKDTREAAQPKVYKEPALSSVGDAKASRGPKLKVDPKTGRVVGAIEGESLKRRLTAGQAKQQGMSAFQGDRWSDDSQLWWTGGSPGDKFTFDLPAFTGTIDLDIVLTTAKDYGVVQVSLDDQLLGGPIDLYSDDVSRRVCFRFLN